MDINSYIPTPEDNMYGIVIGDTVTSTTFSGVYRVTGFETRDGLKQAQLFQIFTNDGKAVKLNRPAYCVPNDLRPAFLVLPELKERANNLNTLVRFLEQLKETTTRI